MKKIIAVCLFMFSLNANAICPTGTTLDFITKVNWSCMFPITIGGSVSYTHLTLPTNREV